MYLFPSTFMNNFLYGNLVTYLCYVTFSHDPSYRKWQAKDYKIRTASELLTHIIFLFMPQADGH